MTVKKSATPPKYHQDLSGRLVRVEVELDAGSLARAVRYERIIVRKLSLVNAAKEAGFSFPYLRQIEDGRGVLNEKVLVAVCKWIDRSPMEFLNLKAMTVKP